MDSKGRYYDEESLRREVIEPELERENRAERRKNEAQLRARLRECHRSMREARDLLLEVTHGSPARSPGHNARLVLERTLAAHEKGE